MATKTRKIRIYPKHIYQDMLWGISDSCNFLWNYQINERKIDAEISLRDQEQALPDLKKIFPQLQLPFCQTLQKVSQRIEKSFKSYAALCANGNLEIKPPSFRSKNRFFSLEFPQKECSFSIIGCILNLAHGFDKAMRGGHSKESISIILPNFDYSNIKTVQICFQNKKWYACMTYDIEDVPLRIHGYTIYFDTGSQTELFGITSQGKLYDYSLTPLRQMNKSTLLFIDKLKEKLSVLTKKSSMYRRTFAKIGQAWSRMKFRTKLFLEKLAREILKDHPHAKAFLYGNWKKKETLANTKSEFANKKINRAIQNNLPLAKLLGILKYMAAQQGQFVDKFNEKGTSSSCIQCRKKTPHGPEKRMFKCGHCGFSYARDPHACLNFLRIHEPAQWRSLFVGKNYPNSVA